VIKLWNDEVGETVTKLSIKSQNLVKVVGSRRRIVGLSNGSQQYYGKIVTIVDFKTDRNRLVVEINSDDGPSTQIMSIKPQNLEILENGDDFEESSK
jgi:hypothetical protein